ncbi:MAG: OsmC family protein [Chloroflexi bacterium]|nr:OsmC family protein [Chloroflexota bacterium]
MALLDSYIARKTAVLAARRADYEAKPESSVISIKASSQVAGITGARPVRIGDHTVLTDSAPGLAGHALGPTAPELLLGSLASCLVHTYLIQAVLLNIPLDHVEIEVSGRLDMAGVVGLPYEQPPRIEDITYVARVQSPALAEDIKRMHRAAEETCPVLNTLRYPVQVRREG